MRITVKTADLKLGDDIKVMEGPYGWARVVEIEADGGVKVERPYASTSDFCYGSPSKLIFYTGIERFTLIPGDSSTFEIERNAKEVK